MARAAHSATSRTIGPLLRLGVSDNGIREASRRLRYHTRSGLSNPGRSTEPISRRFADPVRVYRSADLLPGVPCSLVITACGWQTRTYFRGWSAPCVLLTRNVGMLSSSLAVHPRRRDDRWQTVRLNLDQWCGSRPMPLALQVGGRFACLLYGRTRAHGCGLSASSSRRSRC
jgi:hypothetical protein